MSQPPQPEEIGLGMKLLAGAGTAIATCVGLLYKGAHERIKAVEEKVDTKADEADLVRTKDHVAKIFDQLRDDRKFTTDKFMEFSQTLHGIHADLLKERNK